MLERNSDGTATSARLRVPHPPNSDSYCGDITGTALRSPPATELPAEGSAAPGGSARPRAQGDGVPLPSSAWSGLSVSGLPLSRAHGGCHGPPGSGQRVAVRGSLRQQPAAPLRRPASARSRGAVAARPPRIDPPGPRRPDPLPAGRERGRERRSEAPRCHAATASRPAPPCHFLSSRPAPPAAVPRAASGAVGPAVWRR